MIGTNLNERTIDLEFTSWFWIVLFDITEEEYMSYYAAHLRSALEMIYF